MDEDIPQILEAMDDSTNPKGKLLDKLKRIEGHVEMLRRETFVLEEMKTSLLVTLDSLECSDLLRRLDDGESDDIKRYMERLTDKCLTVDISVKTPRNAAEREALHQVNRLIDEVVVNFRENHNAGRLVCESYLAACYKGEGAPPDVRFQNALRACTEDDQEEIYQRLQGLLNYVNGLGRARVVELN